jgi:hypothetical protein
MTLTAKQTAQIAKAPPAQKAGLRAMYQRQNAQQVTKAKAGSRRPRVQAAQLPSAPKSLAYAFDAFDKRHLPLDEVTAPYTTTNFVSVMEFGSSATMDQVIVVCPRTCLHQENYNGPLSDYIAMRYDAAETISGTIPTLETLRCPIIDKPALTAAAQYFSVRGRLHNMSVRMTCLGTNTGLYPPGSVYIGTVPNIEVGPNSTGGSESLTIKTAWADDSIAVGYIKPVSAAALQNRSVILNAAVAENVSYKSWRDFAVLGSATDLGSMPFSTALEPIVLYVPRAGAGSTVVNYRIEIGQQWCSRHPHNIMLRSTQKQHLATSPSEWHKAVSVVKDVGQHLLERAGNFAMDALATRARGMMALPAPEVD